MTSARKMSGYSAAPERKVSTSSERSGPRSQSCAGMSKPTFGRRSTECGSLSLHQVLQDEFLTRPVDLQRCRNTIGKLDDAMVEKRRPDLQRMRHADAVRLHQNVVGQVVLLVEPQVGVQIAAVAFPSCPRRSASTWSSAVGSASEVNQCCFSRIGERSVPDKRGRARPTSGCRPAGV